MELTEIRSIRKDLRNVKKEFQKRIDEGMSEAYHNGYGLCTMSSISFTVDFIHQHKPTIFSKWFWSRSYLKLQQFSKLIGDKRSYYWWSIDDEGNKQRILFIDYLLTRLNKEQGI